MEDWNRSTRECSLQDLAPEAQQAMKAHIEAYLILGPAFLLLSRGLALRASYRRGSSPVWHGKRDQKQT